MRRPKLGQHWLTDKKVLDRIADSGSFSISDTLIEIGGGKGALTRRLVTRCGRLIVFEIDSKWAEHLRTYLPTWIGPDSTAEVRELDALKIEWTRESLGISDDENLIITGNLPYYITSPFLLRLAYSKLDFKRGIFLIQKEVAQRINAVAGHTDYSRLSVSLGAFLDSEILFDVSPGAFKPPPKVTSSLIRFIPRKTQLVSAELKATFEMTVKAAFHMRRKTLRNNLLAGFPSISGEKIDTILESNGLTSMTRAQEVEIETFADLTGKINDLL